MNVLVPTPEELAIFVRESNAIEGIYVGSGHPLYAHHLAAARWVVDMAQHGRVASPLICHADLLASEPYKWPGQLRRVDVGIGTGHGDIIPKLPWQRVEGEYLELMRRAELAVAAAHGSQPWSEDEIWDLHHRFEWVHPFRDGNGRTGRLFLNALRLVSGYPWLTVRASARQAYYDAIRAWEHEHESNGPPAEYRANTREPSVAVQTGSTTEGVAAARPTVRDLEAAS